MSDEIRVHYGYYEGAEDVVDVGFLQQLPHRQTHEPVRVAEGPGGRLEVSSGAAPDPFSAGAIVISGVATASLTALATIIRSWLQSRRVQVKITNQKTGRSIMYEGPRLKKDLAAISLELEALIGNENNEVRVHPTRIKASRKKR